MNDKAKKKKVRVNGVEVEPINKHKLWEQPGWTHGRIKRLIELKQKEAKAKFAREAKQAENDAS